MYKNQKTMTTPHPPQKKLLVLLIYDNRKGKTLYVPNFEMTTVRASALFLELGSYVPASLWLSWMSPTLPSKETRAHLRAWTHGPQWPPFELGTPALQMVRSGYL